ncbi:MAG: peptidylprolyl isomerase [Deltaproteobacteria bacterium]|nr:peptidylprolyl isomerase [Deltaproteobacteria bacterium]
MTASTTTWTAPTTSSVDPTKKYTAMITTSKGEIVCELDAKAAPLSVTNFKYLADGGFYNGLTFHRVVAGFVVQGGDPTATGSGGPGYTIPAEIGLAHVKGALAWARTGDDVNPERRSSGSQFYITLDATPFLDGQYSVFGRTISGQDIVDKIQRGDVIESIKVTVE